jgi:hypothetical protein
MPRKALLLASTICLRRIAVWSVTATVVICLVTRSRLASADPDLIPTQPIAVELQDGQQLAGRRLTGWSPDPAQVELDGQPLPALGTKVRSIWQHESASSTDAGACVETCTGDRFPGRVVRYVPAAEQKYATAPNHLLLTTDVVTDPGRPAEETLVRVLPNYLQRIVWQPAREPAEPGTLIDRQGRRVPFRAIRWQESSVTVLTSSNRRTFTFDELAELRMPTRNPWPLFETELALLDPQVRDPWVQVETIHGVRVTASWQRTRVVLRNPSSMRSDSSPYRQSSGDSGGDVYPLAETDSTKTVIVQGIQPAWSLDTLWITGRTIAGWRFFSPGEIPLSRLPPAEVLQRSPLAGDGRPWQRDRNVEGGRLANGAGSFRWGFGVHASHQLHFPLPQDELQFRCLFGLDRLAGTGGCVQARVTLLSREGSSRVLSHSPLLVGSTETIALSASIPPSELDSRHLVLEVDEAHQQRPPGADPWDIRDSADWLDPVLTRKKLPDSSEINQQFVQAMPAWNGWHVQPPPTNSIQFTNVWDEFAGRSASFQPAVTLSGQQPLTLTYSSDVPSEAQWLVLGVCRRKKSATPPQIQVRAAGRELGKWEVPLLNRDGIRRTPLVVPLSADVHDGEAEEALQIQLIPSSDPIAIQWYSLDFSDTHPIRRTLLDEASLGAAKGTLISETLVPSTDDALSGDTSFRLTPDKESGLAFAPPIAIQEYPSWGQYRYLRFAIRQQGGGKLSVRLLTNSQRQPVVTYEAGPGTSTRSRTRQVWAEELPDRWIVITRDLVRDFGPLELTGIVFSSRDGRTTLVDAVRLGRSPRDLD